MAKTGYTGSGGIEIYFDTRYAEKIWDKIMIAGNSFGISPLDWLQEIHYVLKWVIVYMVTKSMKLHHQ